MKFIFGFILMVTTLTSLASISFDQEAKDLVEIYSKYNGSPRYSIYNWYGKKKSTNKAIKITMRFRDSKTNNQWDKSFDLVPDENEMLEVQTYRGSSGSTSPELVRARFI